MRRRILTTAIRSIRDTIRKQPLAALRKDQAHILQGILRWGDYSIGLEYHIGGVSSGESETNSPWKWVFDTVWIM